MPDVKFAHPTFRVAIALPADVGTDFPTEKTNTIIFPLPIELIQPFLTKMIETEKKQA